MDYAVPLILLWLTKRDNNCTGICYIHYDFWCRSENIYLFYHFYRYADIKRQEATNIDRVLSKL